MRRFTDTMTDNEEKRVHWRKLKKDHADRTRAVLQSIKENTPCTDCGKKYPYYVMEFDHVHKKSDKVSAISSRSRLYVLNELAKCDVVCANCHRIRTYTRNPSTRIERKFANWDRDHIISIIPQDGEFLVRCSGCGNAFWAEAWRIRWEVQSQELYCSLTCGVRHGSPSWRHNHGGEIREFMGDEEFRRIAVDRAYRRNTHLAWTHPSGDLGPRPVSRGRRNGNEVREILRQNADRMRKKRPDVKAD